jgi:hypothetical protein
MNGLAASRPCATTSSVGAVRAALDQVSTVCAVASASTIMIATSESAPSPTIRPATTMSNTERSSSELRRERDPLAASGVPDQREPGTGDRAGERQAGQLGGRRGGVDRQRVVERRSGRGSGR